MAEGSAPRRLIPRDRMKPRADKAFLLDAGRLGARRSDRERDALAARLEATEQELEKVRQEGAVSAAMAFRTGGSACKVLQREVGVLRAKLAEIENAPPPASSCSPDRTASSSSSSALDTPTLAAELEADNRRLALKLEEQELKIQQASAATSKVRNGEAGTACKPRKDLSDAVERLKGRVDVLTQDNVKLSSDLKLARAKLLTLVPFASRNSGIVEDPKIRTLQVQVEDGKAKLVAARAARQAEAQQHTARIDELDGALQRKDKEREEVERSWQVKYEAAARASAQEDEAIRTKTARYDALLVSLRLSDDEVPQLLDDPGTPPIRSHFPDLSLLDLLWLLTDQHDEHAAAVQVLEEKLGRCESERTRAQKQAAVQAKEERERLQKTIEELRARIVSQGGRGDGSAPARNVSIARPSPSTAAAPSAPSPAVMDRLTSTIASLTDEVSQLRDENMTLLLKLAGAEE